MKPIDVNIVFKYGQEIQKLTEALKNAGKVSVTFDYTAEVAKLKSAISNAVSSVPVTLSFDATIAAFKKKFDEVITDAPVSLAWDKTLEGFKSALNSINNAPIEIKLQYESQLEHLRTEASKAFAGIAVEAEFVNTHPTKIVEKIQSVLNDPEHGLSMFNDQSRFNRAKLVKYIQRLSREINNITNNSQYSIHVPADLGDINKKLQDSMPSLEAGVLVPSVPTDTISEFADLTSKAITDFQTALSKISFDDLTAGLNGFVKAYSDAMSELPVETQAAVDLIYEQLDRIKNFKFDTTAIDEGTLESLRALVELSKDASFGENSELLSFFERLSGAISAYNDNPPSLQSIRDLTDALTGLAQGYSGVVTRADELMNGSFGRLMDVLENFHAPDLSELQGAIQEMLQSFSESLTVHVDGEGVIDTVGLIDAISVLVHSLQGLPDNFIIPFGDEMNNFIDFLLLSLIL